MTATTLDDRLAAAFTDGATSDTVAALIQEAESAARAAGDAAEQAVSRLRERLTQVQAAEEDDRRRAAYEEARAERDELAAELARVSTRRSPRSSLTCSGASAPATIASSTCTRTRCRAGAGPCWSPSWWRASWIASCGTQSISRASSVGFSCRRSNTIFTRPTRGLDPRASTRGA